MATGGSGGEIGVPLCCQFFFFYPVLIIRQRLCLTPDSHIIPVFTQTAKHGFVFKVTYWAVTHLSGLEYDKICPTEQKPPQQNSKTVMQTEDFVNRSTPE